MSRADADNNLMMSLREQRLHCVIWIDKAFYYETVIILIIDSEAKNTEYDTFPST